MVPVSWQVHVRWHNCGLHPLIHTFPTRKLNTKYGVPLRWRDKVFNYLCKCFAQLSMRLFVQMYSINWTASYEP